MAFISKAPRKISFSVSTGTNKNICPGTYNYSTMAESNKNRSSNGAPFGSTNKRKAGEQEVSTDIEELEFQVQSRNNFQYESEVIKKYLRKPLPNYSFDSKLKRIPDHKKLTKSPDPGCYYKDDLREKCYHLTEAGLFQKQKMDHNEHMKGLRDGHNYPKNLPSIPGRNEQFGYTYMDMNPTNAVKNFNPNILDGSKSNSVGPGHYDPVPCDMTKHVPATKMSCTGGLGKRKRNPIPEVGTGNYIGPGSYDPHYMVPNYKFKPSPNFMHSGPKSTQDEEQKKFTVKKINPNADLTVDYLIEATPGPGAYYNEEKQSHFGRQKKKQKFQLFNSSSPRFDDLQLENFVGPGTYNISKKNYIKKTFNQRNVAFNSEAAKDTDTDLQPTHNFPGPGEYVYPYSIGEIANKKLSSAFKKMERRNRNRSEFINLSNSNNQSQIRDAKSQNKSDFIDNSYDNSDNKRSKLEAELSYGSLLNPQINLKTSNVSVKNDGPSAYECQNKKNTNIPSPGPGHYHKLHLNPKYKKKNNDYIFTSAQDRFKNGLEDDKEKQESMPVIGEYSLGYYDIYQEKRHGKQNQKAFGVGDRRFRNLFAEKKDEDEIVDEDELLRDKQNIKGSDKNLKDRNPVPEDDIKYKFNNAFGGGFKGGLVIDSPIQAGNHAPFGTNKNRFSKKMNDEVLGPGAYHQRPTMEKKSYNILFL